MFALLQYLDCGLHLGVLTSKLGLSVHTTTLQWAFCPKQEIFRFKGESKGAFLSPFISKAASLQPFKLFKLTLYQWLKVVSFCAPCSPNMKMFICRGSVVKKYILCVLFIVCFSSTRFKSSCGSLVCKSRLKRKPPYPSEH